MCMQEYRSCDVLVFWLIVLAVIGSQILPFPVVKLHPVPQIFFRTNNNPHLWVTLNTVSSSAAILVTQKVTLSVTTVFLKRCD